MDNGQFTARPEGALATEGTQELTIHNSQLTIIIGKKYLQYLTKKFVKIFGGFKILLYLCTRNQERVI